MATAARSLHLPTPPKPSNPSSHHHLPIPSRVRLRRRAHRLAASSSDLTSFPDPAATPNGVYVPFAAASPAAAIDVDAATEAELRENGFRSTRRTKLVCTVGPATCGPTELEALAIGGMNVARVNMCHGDREWHRGVIRAVRRLNDEKGFAVAVMMDTEGSEIHMGDLGGAPSAKAEDGEVWTFSVRSSDTSLPDRIIHVNYDGFAEDVKVGDELFVDGGMARFEVIEKLGPDVKCCCTDPGLLLPRANLTIWRDGSVVRERNAMLPTISSKDWLDIDFAEKQAEALLDITLRKLTSLERKKFVDEAKTLSEEIFKLNELLSSKKLIFQLIEQEAADLKNKFATPRRSFLDDSISSEVDDIDIIPNAEMLLILSEKGYVKRMNPNTFNLQHRGTIGKSVGKMRMNDSMSDFIVCQMHDHVLYFSDKGIVYSARAYKIPECTRTATGTPLVQLLPLSDGERITSIIPVSEFGEDQYLVMLTINGYIKKVPLNAFSAIRSSGIISIQLVLGDELKWVRCCGNDDLVALASQKGMVIVNTCNKLRALGRRTRGNVAMRLKEGDKMAAMDIIPATAHSMPERYSSRVRDLSPPWLLFIAENGLGKRVPLNAFRQSKFNLVGLKGYKLPPDCRLAAVFVTGFSLTDDGESDEQVVLVSQSGTVNRIKVKDISIQSRAAKGVILMRLEHTGKIQSASLISAAAAEQVAED